MVARTILTKRQDAEIERIRKSAEALAGDSRDIAEAAERVRTVRGPDEVHTRVFRIGAIADLMEAIVEAQKLNAKPQTKPQAKPQAKRGKSKQSKAEG